MVSAFRIPAPVRQQSLPVTFPQKNFHFSYQRYLENQLRSVFGLEGTPIVLTIRQKGEDDG